jgi:hypothetical protein
MTYEIPLLVTTGKNNRHLDRHNENYHAVDRLNFPCGADTESNAKGGKRNPNLFYSIESNGELIPYTTVMVWRKLPMPIHINNELVTRYKAPKIVEYLDPSTGEIIQASDVRNDPRLPPEIHFGEILLLRQSLLDSMRKEVREFALFVLNFRNNRRGVTPEIDTLVDWYAHLQGKRPSNIRRYVQVLEDVGFLAGSSLLSRLFQRTGKRTAARDHLGEDVIARRKYFALRFRARLGVGSFSNN